LGIGGRLFLDKGARQVVCFDRAALVLKDTPALSLRAAVASNRAICLAGSAELSGDFEIAGRYYGQALRMNKDFAPAQQNAKRIDELARRGTSKEPFALGYGELETTG
jgi:hypothetical protein